MSYLLNSTGTIALWRLDETSGLSIADVITTYPMTASAEGPTQQIVNDTSAGFYGRHFNDAMTYTWGGYATGAADLALRTALRAGSFTVAVDFTSTPHPASGQPIINIGVGSPPVVDDDQHLLRVSTGVESIQFSWATSAVDVAFVSHQHFWPESPATERILVHLALVPNGFAKFNARVYVNGEFAAEYSDNGIDNTGWDPPGASPIGDNAAIWFARAEAANTVDEQGWADCVIWGAKIVAGIMTADEIREDAGSPSFTETLTEAPRCLDLWHWIEIAGLPRGYGNFTATSALFSGRALADQRLLVKPWSVSVPSGFDQRVNVLDGSSTIGQLETEILDPQGILAGELGLGVARSDLWLVLQDALSATETTSLTVLDAPATAEEIAAYPTGGGVIYIGAETIAYASRIGAGFLTLTRGLYGSTPTAHGQLSPVTPYARSLNQRNAQIYYVLDDQGPPATPADDAAKVTRLTGIVAASSQGANQGSFRLTLEDATRKVSGWVGVNRKRKIFANPWRCKLTASMPHPSRVGSWPGEDDADVTTETVTSPGGNEVTLIRDNFIEVDGGLGLNAQRFNLAGSLAQWNTDANGKSDYYWFVRIENEILLLKRADNGTTGADGNRVDVWKRGLFGTVAAKHETGSDVVEVMPVMYSADTAGDNDPLEFLPWISDNPIDIALQLITSTGTGTNGAYDTLPAAWGMGVPVAYLDLVEIERTRDLYLPGVRGQTIIVEDGGFDLREWLQREVFRPFGCFPLTKLGGLYSIRSFGFPTPLELAGSVISWGHNKLVEAPSWDSNADAVIGEVKYDFNHNPLTGKYTQTERLVFAETSELYSGVYGEQAIPSTLLRDGTAREAYRNAFVMPLSPLGNGRAWAQSRIAWWGAWFSRPPPVWSAKTSWEQIGAEPGDYVLLTFSGGPDIATGSLGVTDAVCTISQKRPNDEQGYIEWELLQLGAVADGVRNISPSGLVTAWDAGNKLVTIDGQEFADAGQTSTAWGGVALWAVGYAVRFASADLDSYSASTTITAVNGNTFTLAAVPGGHAISVGDILVFGDYDSQSAEQKARFASLADDQRTLGAAADPSHTHQPS